ncbi:hypothetical protein [Vibrio vulnificus YJ016]|uniref:Uncharacterized protein n=1 Tax=Vibrio vulnificus (strain YJ016) TaxID=196600 RepID=Q7MPS2_VIBVY|nr:hypothetical protein [Vibrio vulnificus YJ016]
MIKHTDDRHFYLSLQPVSGSLALTVRTVEGIALPYFKLLNRFAAFWA